ncbi:hypothetical protein HID58_065447, partial [Brassica napus]
ELPIITPTTRKYGLNLKKLDSLYKPNIMAMHSSSAAEYVEYDHYLIKRWNTMDLTKMTTSIIPNPNLGLLAQQRGSMASDFQHMANSSYLFLRQNLTCPRWSTRLAMTLIPMI